VKDDYLPPPPQAQTACSCWWSFTTCMQYVLLELPLSFPIRLTLFSFSFQFAFCNLPPFFVLALFSSILFLFFSSFVFPPIPSLPHRSGCSCGTRRGRSGFVASSRATSETLLLLSSCMTSQVGGSPVHSGDDATLAFFNVHECSDPLERLLLLINYLFIFNCNKSSCLVKM